jgi:apolipoprotein D and lipocalin family protein
MMTYRLDARYAFFAGLLLTLCGCSTMREPLRTVPHVDLPKYMGDWYVIGEIPNYAERDCVDSIESYALRQDGDIDNWFTCRKKTFDAPMKRRVTAKAVVIDTTSNAIWRVRLFHVIPVKYLILELDPAYQWAAVGHPSRRYGWILARSKSMDDATYGKILDALGQQGYDTAKFKRVPQSPAATSSSAAAP